VDDEASILGERLDLRGRHSGDEIREMLAGNVSEHLFVREVLVERAKAEPAPPLTPETGVP
jgi:ribose 1,5-bisphosphokinase PhnN